MESRIVTRSLGIHPLRRWPRFSIELPVRVYCELSSTIHEGRGSSLNCGGMAVHTSVDLCVGDQVSVEFTPPQAQQPVRARCFIRNRRQQTYGVEFLTENDADYCTVGQIEYNLHRLTATSQ